MSTTTYNRYKHIIIKTDVIDDVKHYEVMSFKSINKAKLYNRTQLNSAAKVLEYKLKLDGAKVDNKDMTKWEYIKEGKK